MKGHLHFVGRYEVKGCRANSCGRERKTRKPAASAHGRSSGNARKCMYCFRDRGVSDSSAGAAAKKIAGRTWLESANSRTHSVGNIMKCLWHQEIGPLYGPITV